MIEKLNLIEKGAMMTPLTTEKRFNRIIDKLNELVDAVNTIQQERDREAMYQQEQNER